MKSAIASRYLEAITRSFIQAALAPRGGSPTRGVAYRRKVYLQKPNTATESIAVHPQPIGGPALVSFLVLQHRQNESPLELPQCLLELHAGPVHFEYKVLKLSLHGELLRLGLL